MSVEEQTVARRLSGGFGRPTVLLVFALLSIEAGMIFLWAVCYRAAIRERRPLLVANGAIIQGTGTTPHGPIQLREHAATEV